MSLSRTVRTPFHGQFSQAQNPTTGITRTIDKPDTLEPGSAKDYIAHEEGMSNSA